MKTKLIAALTVGAALLLGSYTPSRAQAQAPGEFAFRQSTSLCSTSGVAGNTCAEPTVTIPTGYSTNTNYVCSATCEGTVTGVPVVQTITKAAASPKIQVVIAALTAATASCTGVMVRCSSVTAAAQ